MQPITSDSITTNSPSQSLTEQKMQEIGRLFRTRHQEQSFPTRLLKSAHIHSTSATLEKYTLGPAHSKTIPFCPAAKQRHSPCSKNKSLEPQLAIRFQPSIGLAP